MAGAGSIDDIVPEDGSILITAVNGYIGSNLANEFLSRGYRVRGTVRSLTRCRWLQEVFDERFGGGRFTMVQLEDLADQGAFEREIERHKVSSIVSTTTVNDYFQTDPNEIIPRAVEICLVPLRAASRVPSVKAVTMTSSSWAVETPLTDVVTKLDESSWNESAVRLAYDESYTDAARKGPSVYMATSVKTEQAAWAYVNEHHPHYRFNTILVSAVFGRIVSFEHQGFPSTAGFLNGPRGIVSGRQTCLPQWFVDVQDVARLHLAATTFGSINSRRLFAYGAPFSWNEIVEILKAARTDAYYGEPDPDEGQCLSEPARDFATEILERIGRPGWTTLEDSIKETVSVYPYSQADVLDQLWSKA